jgi:hypothetical protein
MISSQGSARFSLGGDDVSIQVDARRCVPFDVSFVSGMVSPPRITTGELTPEHQIPAPSKC